MADILTQLQTCLDQLATQFYATIGYLNTYHDHSAAIPPSDVPDAAPQLAKIPKNQHAHPVPATAAAQAKAAEQASPPPANAAANDPNAPPPPDSPRTFAARQRELARDLIIKEQQIEYLIKELPGIGSSEEEQEKRIQELGKELRDVEEEKERKAQELKTLGQRLEKVLGAIETGIYGDEIPQR
ncbi:Mediator of RNA polymerase II transcription subunit 21 [Paecilomyces lecythidis]|uniref:Mediator of RNA polymerase II transcription subunit 21 n=1 Tax=Paecilomyces lecythidis TaxID=3004212 RepID=A0ABR3Y8B5_9EURO